MATTYVGVAAYIATSSMGDTVVDLEFDIDANSLLVIVGPAGRGSGSSVYTVPDPRLWGPGGIGCYITNVVDTQSNDWGYAMYDQDVQLHGLAPMTITAAAMDAGTDTITITLIQPSSPFSASYVGRVLCFTGVPLADPPCGCPVAAVVPTTNSMWNGTSFFTLDPGDQISLPALINSGEPTGGMSIPRQEADDDIVSAPWKVGPQIANNYNASQTLWFAYITWDGTTAPWDYYYTSGAEDPAPTPVVGPAPGALGLSSDNGTWYFDAYEPAFAPFWVDLEHDALGSIIERRYAYMIQNTPITEDNVDVVPIIGGDYLVGEGVWGNSFAQENDDSFPYEPGSWNPPPTYPLGDPNGISAPLWPSLSFMEGIVGGPLVSAAGIYASAGAGGATTGTGTFDPDTMVGISHVQRRGGAT